jgi:4-diphosphocytidyl-2-C-methyl-D-erythritol kinase
MNQIKILAPAKINLFLRILNKRKDGYHDIETVSEKVSLYDKIVLEESKSSEIVVKSNSKDPCFKGANNTVYKAISLLRDKLKIKKGVRVFVEKHIPVGAGLAGGSSDAAETLKGLDKLWKLGIPRSELLNFAGKIGSDVPLFVFDESFLLGRGRGERLCRISGTQRLKLWHILVTPSFKISTAYAYSLFDRYHFSRKRDGQGFESHEKLRLTIPSYSANIITCALFDRDVSLLNYYSYNSFKSVILKKYIRLFRLNRVLEGINKDFVHLSGSGSTLFMTFFGRKEAEYLVKKVKRAVGNCRVFLVHTC